MTSGGLIGVGGHSATGANMFASRVRTHLPSCFLKIVNVWPARVTGGAPSARVTSSGVATLSFGGTNIAQNNFLLNGTDVATLFLDRSLCIRKFTQRMDGLLFRRANEPAGVHDQHVRA